MPGMPGGFPMMMPPISPGMPGMLPTGAAADTNQNPMPGFMPMPGFPMQMMYPNQ